MSKKYYCYISAEEMTEKVVDASKEKQIVVKALTQPQQIVGTEISVFCSKGHENLFKFPDPDIDNTGDKKVEIFGKKPPTDYNMEMSDLKKQIIYENCLTKLENFAKWLFTSVSIVATLAAGFSINGFANLNRLGNILVYVSFILYQSFSFLNPYQSS